MRLPVSFLLFFLFVVSMPLTAAPGDEIAPGDGVAGGSRANVPALAPERRRSMAIEEELAGKMVLIPGGVFRMGDLSGEGTGNERPVRDVAVASFWLGKYEVTFAQWDACMADGGCEGYRPHNIWGRGNRPVTRVSWDDAQGFIRWLNARTGNRYRLPTEAEWEYAARAGTSTEYPWGDAIGHNKANCQDCDSRWDNDPDGMTFSSGEHCSTFGDCSAPVGSFPANEWGLHDMHGNAWEWVQDCWNGNYAGAPGDGKAWNSGDCSRRVIRGGSWSHYARPWHLRSAARYRYTSSVRSFGAQLGFRLARDL